MFEFDICFCGNPEGCDRRETCERCMTEDQRKRSTGMLISYSTFHKAGQQCQHYIRRKDGKATRVHC